MPRRRRPGAGADLAPQRVFVDSGAWIALFSARDQHHVEADQLFRLAVARRIPLLTTNLILAEVHRLLLYRAGTLPAGRALDHIEASSQVKIRFATAADHSEARAWLQSLAPQEITYADAVSFAVMDADGCTSALTFDNDFSRAGFTRWRH